VVHISFNSLGVAFGKFWCLISLVKKVMLRIYIFDFVLSFLFSCVFYDKIFLFSRVFPL